MTITYGSVCSGIEAAPVMRWIGERINLINGIVTQARGAA